MRMIVDDPKSITTFMRGIHDGKDYQQIYILIVENLEESERTKIRQLREDIPFQQFSYISFSVVYEGETFVSVPLMNNLVYESDLKLYRKLIKSSYDELRIIIEESKKWHFEKSKILKLREYHSRKEHSVNFDENSINEANELLNKLMKK